MLKIGASDRCRSNWIALTWCLDSNTFEFNVYVIFSSWGSHISQCLSKEMQGSLQPPYLIVTHCITMMTTKNQCQDAVIGQRECVITKLLPKRATFSEINRRTIWYAVFSISGIVVSMATIFWQAYSKLGIFCSYQQTWLSWNQFCFIGTLKIVKLILVTKLSHYEVMKKSMMVVVPINWRNNHVIRFIPSPSSRSLPHTHSSLPLCRPIVSDQT